MWCLLESNIFQPIAGYWSMGCSTSEVPSCCWISEHWGRNFGAFSCCSLSRRWVIFFTEPFLCTEGDYVVEDWVLNAWANSLVWFCEYTCLPWQTSPVSWFFISLLKVSVHACVLSSDKEQKDSFHFCGYRWQLPLPWEHSKAEMCCCELFELNLKKPSPLGLCFWWVLHNASAIQAYISMFNISWLWGCLFSLKRCSN